MSSETAIAGKARSFMPYCTHCGIQVKDEYVFCTACGTRRLQVDGSKPIANQEAGAAADGLPQPWTGDANRDLLDKLALLDASGVGIAAHYRDPWGREYRKDAPCSMCHQRVPNTQTIVDLTDRITGTLSRRTSFLVPVCQECRGRYEAHGFFREFTRMRLEGQVRRWLGTYHL